MSGDGTARPHVTLILGAGGPVGQAFHAGVLRALDEICGWDARQADLIVGTSAGAQLGALLRLGWDSHRLLHRATQPRRPEPRPEGRARWPASLAYLRKVVTQPSHARIGPLVSALLPEGLTHAPHLGEGFARLFPWRWPHRPLWIPAVHVDSGARIVFGRDDAPEVDVATAVRCSSAVPAVRPPVPVGEQRFVDGGVSSPTHSDLAMQVAAPPESRRVVVVLSPMSRFLVLRLLLRTELRPIMRRGIDVILFEPDSAVATAMGWNPLDSSRVEAVADAAYRATVKRLRRRGSAGAVRLLVGT